MGDASDRLHDWFRARGWSPFDYQKACWSAYRDGKSGLIHAGTGVGKTLAAWGGPLLDALDEDDPGGGLRVLWVTPLRALARDTVESLRDPMKDLGLPWTVEHRMGDTPRSIKTRQRKRMPEALVTTPESLSLLLSYPESGRLLRDVHAVVVDEWHELLSSKRGVQTELALARLRRLSPGLRIWGLSATLGNLEEARDVLVPGHPAGVLLRGPVRHAPEMISLVPEEMDRFPWAGHIGLSLLPAVADVLDGPGTALVFTNTRSQAEIWHRALLEARPEWREEIALHHGSLDDQVRRRAELGLAEGTLRAVVCTSSLDLGVDFHPVDKVLQIGSPKGVGRLLQRAGRSGHTPRGTQRIYCVPTHALELAEFAAARSAIERDRIEPRRPLEAPLDVLVQHLVTVALGGGFDSRELLAEVRTSHAYRKLAEEAWGWCLDFASRGGPALTAYDRYARIREENGRWVASRSRAISRNHRMSIGTITDDGPMEIRFLKGQRLGSVDESFLSRLRPGDVFTFAGRRLRLVRVRDMTAFVRLAGSRARGVVPRWMGGRMPLSSELGVELLEVLSDGSPSVPERDALNRLLQLQRRWSRLPAPGTLLVERVRTREGHHLFLYPFLGRRAHDGLGALLAFRLSRRRPVTVRISANDYGIELLSGDPFDISDGDWPRLLDPAALGRDLGEALNEAELGRRHFREIARISGLVLTGYPGRRKSARQLQVSTGLIHDILRRYDPDNLLLEQTRREVMERELERSHLLAGLSRISEWQRLETEPPRLTPLAFPIWAERIQAQVSSESWKDRVGRMVVRLEKAAEKEMVA